MAPTTYSADGQPSDGDRVRKYRGCLALCFAPDSALLAALEHIIEQQSGAIPRAFERLPTSQWHITLVTKAELRTLSAAAVVEAEALSLSRVFPIGLGGAVPLGVYFVVCVWPRAQAFRRKHGLPLKDFHVSVSVQNNHEVDKTVTALLDLDGEASWMEALGVEALEAVARQLLLEGESKQSYALLVATHLCAKFGAETTRGWLRLGEAALQTRKYKLAMLSFAHAYDRVSSHSFSYSTERRDSGEDPDAVRQFCLARMQTCSAFTEWGQAFLESEMHEIPASLSRHLLQQRWSDALCSAVRECSQPTDRSGAPRDRVWVVSRMAQLTGASPYFRLPRFFRWIVPFQLAAMSTPRDEADIVHLARSVGIRHVVTLTKEQPLVLDWFPALPNAVVNTFLAVENYEAPSLAQIDLFIKICCESTGVLVHCGGGKGRAGVMVACYLVAFGFRPPPPSPLDDWVQPAMAADEAIRTLRAIRPSSIETERQEAIVAAYSSLLWKRRCVLPVPVEEPMASKPIVSGEPLEGADLLVLCGLPGSGKTTFRRMLVKRSMAAESGKQRHLSSTGRWVELSGDEHGREGCERSLGLKGVQRAILDRVSGKREDRRAFLEIARTWSTHATAVWFDFDANVCVYRAQQRANHPTLPPGRRVENAVAQHAQEFTAPELAEGFATIVRLTSLQAARDLAEMLAPPIGLLRFPRTSHVINLGAATADDLVMADMPTSPLGGASGENADVIVVTEKIDGANLGISLAADGWTFVVQNRSHYVTSKSHVQFRKLDAFLEAHGAALRSLLHQDALFPERFILYGEWMAATHSIPYTHLRDLFYAFDLYDRETRRFWDRRSLEAALTLSAPPSGGDGSSRSERIQIVPKLWSGSRLPDDEALIAMARQTRSQFYDGVVEGLYIKWESPGVGVRHRGKVVRGDFLAGNEHWSTGAIRLNTVVPPAFDEM